MRTQLEIDTGEAGKLRKVLEPSLTTDEKVSYRLDDQDSLEIEIETQGTGPLRGATDTAFRLAMLAEKIITT